MIIDTTNANILIVDDQEINVRLLEKILDQAGYRNITGITDSREVEQLYADHQYDLILLDIRMPHLNGFEVLERLNKIHTDSYIPVLILTAQNDQETKLRALQLGAKDFLTKPFDQTEVLLRIQNLLEVRLLHQQQRDLNKVLDQRVRDPARSYPSTRARCRVP